MDIKGTFDLSALGAAGLSYLGSQQINKQNIAATERANAANLAVTNANNAFQADLAKQNLALEKAKLAQSTLETQNTMAQDDSIQNTVNSFYNSKNAGSAGGLSASSFKSDYNTAGNYSSAMNGYLGQIDPDKLMYNYKG